MAEQGKEDVADLLIIGGGVNGCGIARDAAGRGLGVVLAEMGDLGSATSSASTKMFHGGLRYLEYFKIRLVRESLAEREVLLRAMPHISWPMRFVLPLHPDMRFPTDTPAARLLGLAMPWLRGRRPAWVIRLALFFYDHLGGREVLPATSALDLARDPAGAPLKPALRRAFEYSDCWVDDARLVVLNARDAKARGAEILTRTRVLSARRSDGLWHVMMEACGQRFKRCARVLVNAAGPWAGSVAAQISGDVQSPVKLVRGSHIVTRRVFDHDRAYFFQGGDGRVIFAIPYEDDFTLIGTTDEAHDDPDTSPRCTEIERDYLLDFASQYFKRPVVKEDIVWTYSGVRPLYDDGASSAKAATRDYVLQLDATDGAPVLHVFGGKITTYRRLAEAALARLAPHMTQKRENWTAGVPLPGGDFAVSEREALAESLQRDYPFLTRAWAHRLMRTYGTCAREFLGSASNAADLGIDFGATLSEAELRWLRDYEFARSATDVLWRRTKLGLRLDPLEIERVERWFAAQTPLGPGA